MADRQSGWKDYVISTIKRRSLADTINDKNVVSVYVAWIMLGYCFFFPEIVLFGTVPVDQIENDS